MKTGCATVGVLAAWAVRLGVTLAVVCTTPEARAGGGGGGGSEAASHAKQVEAGEKRQAPAHDVGTNESEQAPANMSERSAEAEEAASADAEGGYAGPALKLPQRGGFGAAAGKAAQLSQVAEPHELSGVLVQVLLGLTLVAVVVTLMTAARLSRMQRADGRTERALTVGAKVSLSLGGMTTLLLALGTMGMRAQVQIAEANNEVEALTDRMRVVHEFEGDLSDLQLGLRQFIQEDSAERYKGVNDALATLKARVDQGIKYIVTGERAAQVGELGEAFEQIEQGAREVVRLHDERMGTFQSQTLPTAMHVTKVLGALHKDVEAKEGAAAALAIARASEQYQQARIGLFKFLRTDREADMRESIGLVDECTAMIENAAGLVKSPVFKERLAEAKAATEYWHTRLERMLAVTAERDRAVQQVEMAFSRFHETSAKLESSFGQSESAAKANIDGTLASSAWALAGLIGVGVLIAIGVSTTLVRSINGAIAPVIKTLQRVSKGDLTVKPINSTSKDELGEVARMTDATVASLRDVLGEVSTSSQDVSAAATEIAASAEEMSASVGEVARQASQATQAAGGAGKSATTGSEIVGQTVSSMRSIHESVAETSQSIQQLGKRSEEIGKIIEVINDIADQTNLLALNAAIEAARAGEHGRGFAVVADEVRKLAERTTKATEEVSSSIKAIQQGTAQAVTVMNRGSTLVETGVGFADQAKQNLESIVGGAGEVASMIKAIHAAGEEAGAGASQSAAAAQQLSSRAEQLRTMVGRFKI